MSSLDKSFKKLTPNYIKNGAYPFKDVGEDPRLDLLFKTGPALPEAVSENAYWGFEGALHMTDDKVRALINEHQREMPIVITKGNPVDLDVLYDELLKKQLGIKFPALPTYVQNTTNSEKPQQKTSIKVISNGTFIVNLKRRNVIVHPIKVALEKISDELIDSYGKNRQRKTVSPSQFSDWKSPKPKPVSSGILNGIEKSPAKRKRPGPLSKTATVFVYPRKELSCSPCSSSVKPSLPIKKAPKSVKQKKLELTKSPVAVSHSRKLIFSSDSESNDDTVRKASKYEEERSKKKPRIERKKLVEPLKKTTTELSVEASEMEDLQFFSSLIKLNVPDCKKIIKNQDQKSHTVVQPPIILSCPSLEPIPEPEKELECGDLDFIDSLVQFDLPNSSESITTNLRESSPNKLQMEQHVPDFMSNHVPNGDGHAHIPKRQHIPERQQQLKCTKDEPVFTNLKPVVPQFASETSEDQNEKDTQKKSTVVPSQAKQSESIAAPLDDITKDANEEPEDIPSNLQNETVEEYDDDLDVLVLTADFDDDFGF